MHGCWRGGWIEFAGEAPAPHIHTRDHTLHRNRSKAAGRSVRPTLGQELYEHNRFLHYAGSFAERMSLLRSE